MQYGFQDDGTIACRLAATARNLPGREMEAHMHNGCWRIDMDLNGPGHNSVYLMEHHEPASGSTLKAADTHVPFNNGIEAAADWVPERFTMLNVQNTQTKNPHRQNIRYELMPMRHCTARHAED